MSRFLSNYTDVEWTLVGFFIFFIMFLIIVGKTFSKSEIEVFKKVERLPLDEENSSTK